MKEIEEEIVMQPASEAVRTSAQDLIGLNNDVGLQSLDIIPRLFGSDGVKVPDGSTTAATSTVSIEGVDPIAPPVEQRIAEWQGWMPIKFGRRRTKDQKRNEELERLNRWNSTVLGPGLLTPLTDKHPVHPVPKSKPPKKNK